MCVCVCVCVCARACVCAVHRHHHQIVGGHQFFLWDHGYICFGMSALEFYSDKFTPCYRELVVKGILCILSLILGLNRLTISYKTILN